MSAPKFTPGPWKVKRSGCISDGLGELVATTGYRVRAYAEDDDNARLIALSPTMFEALRKIEVGTSPESFAVQADEGNLEQLIRTLHEIACAAIAEGGEE